MQQQKPCAAIMAEVMDQHGAILSAQFDKDAHRLALGYDDSALAAAEVRSLAGDLLDALDGQAATCTFEDVFPTCEGCTAAQVPAKYKALRFGDAVVSVRREGMALAPAEVIVEATQQQIADLPQRPQKPFIREWLSDQGLPIAFVVITLVAMVAARILEATQPTAATILYGVAYVTGGTFGVQAGLESLRALKLDVDLLMVLAAAGAWLVGAPFEGALLLFLFSLSNVLQEYALDRTTSAIRSLMKLRPEEAMVRRGPDVVRLPVEQLEVGDVVIVRPGESIPVDGEVIEGETTVDQAAITGESIPVTKQVGDEVLTGTINQSGGIEVRTKRLASESTLARVIRMVEEAREEKANTESFIDRFEEVYAWGVLAFTALVVAIPPLVFGEVFDEAFYRGMTVLVAASPCALVISTPAVILSAIGNGARRGMLFKGGIYVEQAADVKVVAFDKTGTLTHGKLAVTALVPFNGTTEDELLTLAAAVEARSEHPLAAAVVAEAKARELSLPEAQAFQSDAGKGVRAAVDRRRIHIGNVRYFAERFADEAVIAPVRGEVTRLQDEGNTAVIVVEERTGGAKVLGVIALADRIREDVAAIVRDIKAQGIERVVMLTGDNERVARAIAAQTGVDEYYADLLPADKVTQVKALQEKYGPVAMIGDGVNDAPALASANIGVAMGAAGTDVALETADIVLMADDLDNVPYVMALSRKTRRTLIINLGFALTMIAIMIGAIFLYDLPLPLAVVGHEGGTVLVSLHGLTLLAFNRSRK